MRAHTIVKLLYGLISCYWLGLCQEAKGQYALGGYTGLILSPTAQMAKDGNIQLGVSYLPPAYALLKGPAYGEKLYSLTLTFLPFLEVHIGVTRPDQVGKAWGIGDRRTGLRVRLLPETAKFPALVVGLHDPPLSFGNEPGQTEYFHALYLVASKEYQLFRQTSLSFHLGYGEDWLKARQYQIVGFFGGVAMSPWKSVTFLAEYDSDKINMGFRWVLFHHLQLMGTVFHFDKISGGLSYHFNLMSLP